jgi:hypothetical protein
MAKEVGVDQREQCLRRPVFLFPHLHVPGQKLVRPCLKNKLGIMVYTYGPSYSEGGSRSIMI